MNERDDQEAGLRARLVDVGVELVATRGVQALTLREIARRAGVSHGAPRRYFPTHVSLLSAIARRGFGELAVEVGKAVGEGPDEDARARLRALSRAYLGFAVTHRGMFELMFRHDLLESDRLGLRETSLPLFDVLAGLVAEARPASGAGARVVAGALWANLHGIAQLWGWGSLRLATGAEDVEALLDAALDAHLGPEAS
ncbi:MULTISPECIES: TetR/AcrR family transcriptional regulator [Streptomyces]|uniref:TetR family transcriptional regulator n=1 Tax=Streptomyces venezuelae TaxID=54571 RepID=A0A5P2B6M7_STRVZ|nr:MULTISPECIES: TetR/AcrR family transcriptional regulator [Streptomyces]MYY83286.1 TetR family transcriptional regulator [Streptomyces sp. SID335]NDZ99022.1 TetR/AcrR family transcriptional regulator [Streptomyces sp. SID10116]MYZ15264.1 TetR family transcriptional regulator [Streptomyces sp. SID337]NDZ86427.1 TetR/AcrR family transcriptional regulator [Streptomyces sp. SID10115]NEB43285.1 TetR/AcrR family transcriptional regulator [Streptomyces sp. SID339]